MSLAVEVVNVANARQELGRIGEDRAASYLEANGAVILDRNWRCDLGELDIVACESDQLVIVEVKTRSSTAFGTPLEAISSRKVRRLRQLAVRWLEWRGLHAPRIRFDVIGIVRESDDHWRLHHVRGID